MEGGGGSGSSEELAVGCLLSIKTTLGDKIRWPGYRLRPLHQHTRSQEDLKSGTGRNIRLLNANYIKEFSFLGQAEDPLDAKKCFLDLNGLQAREELAVWQAEADARRIGAGVTSEAQIIFDALCKTPGSLKILIVAISFVRVYGYPTIMSL